MIAISHHGLGNSFENARAWKHITDNKLKFQIKNACKTNLTPNVSSVYSKNSNI